VVVLASADCQSYRLATVQSTTYAGNMAKGTVVAKSLTFPKEALRYIAVARSSGSANDRVMKSLCGIGKRARAQH
jgi:hypothetical protein